MHGDDPLHCAVLVGDIYPHLMEALLKAGHSVDVVDNRGITPLLEVLRRWSSASTTMPIVARLKEAGANLNPKDDLGRTTLHYVAGNNNPQAIEYFVGLGADINARIIMVKLLYSRLDQLIMLRVL